MRLTAIDDLWSDYLATVADLRSGIHWVSWAARDPLHEYLVAVDGLYQQLEQQIEEEGARRLEEAEAGSVEHLQRGATWTYLTTDQPFGTQGERFLRGVVRKIKKTFA
jgi:preprotein translocase subunit SecA